MRSFGGELAGASGIAAALLLSAAPALAQRVAGDDPQFGSSGITSVSPVEGRGWKLTAGLRTLYDSNILRLNDNQAVPTGSSKSDFRFTPSITAATGLPVGRQQIFIGGIYGHDYYARNTQLDRDRYLIGGGVNLRAGSSCTGTVAGEFSHRQSLLSDVSVTIPNVQETLTYGGTANCQGATGIGFGGSVIRHTVDNKNPQRDVFDLGSTNFSGNIGYGSPTLGRFSISGNYDKVDYTHRTQIVPGGGMVGDGTDTYDIRLGYQRGVGSRLSISVSAGYNKVMPKPKTILQPIFFGPILIGFQQVDRDGFSGISYDLSLAYHSGTRLNATLSASRSANSSSNVGALFVISQAYGFDVGYDLSPSISTGAGVTYDVRDYRGAFASGTENLPRQQDKTSRIYGRVTYSPVKLYDIDFEVGHQKRDSNPATYSYNSTTALVTLRVKFGRG